MPANSSLSAHLPACFPSRSRQFFERAPTNRAAAVPRISFQRALGNQRRLPSFQCCRGPPSLQPARGIPFVGGGNSGSVRPPARSPSSSASAPLRSPAFSYQLTVASYWIPSLDNLSW